ncbi:hypothetical protein CFOL_v3_18138 [Cephalotus follicularis]|uniref:Uncharacterized protein n=1 Tax=Cephalotus follicularis TaxID=3775 RepID=A0A1Q3C3J0_CEPFO|nr:hypothetical protein CFOL_v3_18138 [Cephalotus follicularis]
MCYLFQLNMLDFNLPWIHRYTLYPLLVRYCFKYVISIQFCISLYWRRKDLDFPKQDEFFKMGDVCKVVGVVEGHKSAIVEPIIDLATSPVILGEDYDQIHDRGISGIHFFLLCFRLKCRMITVGFFGTE